MRIFLFMLMQSAILVVVGFIGFIVMSAFDIQLDQNSYISMFVGSLIFGFAGSLISGEFYKLNFKKLVTKRKRVDL